MEQVVDKLLELIAKNRREHNEKLAALEARIKDLEARK